MGDTTLKMFTFIPFLMFLLVSCSAGNSACNNRSHTDCKGEWTGTECGPPGRGYTCTDNGNGGILSPECSCLNGQGDPPPAGEEVLEIDDSALK
jgi:hypothetical protein